MGFWSKVWQKVKIVSEIVGRVFGLLDLLLGFVEWPPKKMVPKEFITQQQTF